MKDWQLQEIKSRQLPQCSYAYGPILLSLLWCSRLAYGTYGTSAPSNLADLPSGISNPWSRSRRLTSHAAVEFFPYSRSRIWCPVFRRSHWMFIFVRSDARSRILRIKCTKFDFYWGSVPDAAKQGAVGRLVMWLNYLRQRRDSQCNNVKIKNGKWLPILYSAWKR